MSNNISSDIDGIYTIEDIESYGSKLHYSTVITLIMNIFAGYIVLKYSSEAMGKYKYYIFLTIATAGILDFHATFVFGIFPTFPLPGFCGAGFIAKNLDWFWGEVIQYLILQELFSICGSTLLACILYRYYSLKGKIEFFHSFRGILIMSIFAVLYPSSVTVLLFTNMEDRNETLRYVKENAPNMYNLYIVYPACSCLKSEIATPFATLMFLHIVLLWIIGFIFVLKTVWELSLKRKSLSKATYKMYKEFLYAIIVQASVPIFFICLPAIGVAGCFAFKIYKTKDYAAIAMQGLFLHSSINSLCILLTIKVYRQAVFNLLLKPFWCYKKSQNIVKVTQALTSTAEM